MLINVDGMSMYVYAVYCLDLMELQAILRPHSSCNQHANRSSTNVGCLLIFIYYITIPREVCRRLFGEPNEAGTCVKVSFIFSNLSPSVNKTCPV